uniref:Uncharacterized protein n=1 Tax=Chaetoceros debilis TaxID=122233 RepID=A0A6S8ZK17_9STRA
MKEKNVNTTRLVPAVADVDAADADAADADAADKQVQEQEQEDHYQELWPENDPNRRHNVFQKVIDGLLYPYMGGILRQGAVLHKERKFYVFNSKHSVNSVENGSGEETGSGSGIAIPKELSQEDLYQAPSHMRAELLLDRFQMLYKQKHQELMDRPTLEEEKKQSSEKKVKKKNDRSGVGGVENNNNDDDHGVQRVRSSRKERGWVLIKTLWGVSNPGYIYAGYAQLVSTLAQCFYPLAVQYLLRVLERYPDQSVFGKGVGFVICLFTGSIVDGIAQERTKFGSSQAGITIRAATVSAIYHHMLNLSSVGKHQLLMGETTNLVAIDCQKLFEVCQEGHLLWSCPLSMLIVMILLLITLGPTTLVGMISMFMLVPVVKKVVEMMMAIRKKRAVFTDRRVDTMTAMLQAIRFCKLNNYEEKFLKRVHEAREKEMVWVKKELRMLGWALSMTVLTPVVACALTFITYALVNGGNVLTSSDTFTTLLLFSVLRFPIGCAGKLMGKAAQGLEACERIADFLERESVAADTLEKNNNHDDESNDGKEILLEVKNGTFTVGGSNGDQGNGMVDPEVSGHSGFGGKAEFKLSGINISIKKGETLACVGPVGSGKSTLLHALIGDVSSSESSDITMRGSVAYASQSPFILNATLRDNILFGLDYKKDLYDRVLEACNLLPDLEKLGQARDLTEIGERGVTLSGGQKARISLARCVYSQPSIALFDDILSALDAATGKYVFEQLFEPSRNGSGLLSKTAVILVTHASHFLSRVGNILVLVKGKSVFVGNWHELLSVQTEDCAASQVINSIRSSVQEKDIGSDETSRSKRGKFGKDEAASAGIKDGDDGILMTEEERDFGLSDVKTWFTWFKYAGGAWFVTLVVVSLTIDRGLYVMTEWWLASWTTAVSNSINRFGVTFAPQEEGLSAQRDFVKVYGIILVASSIATFARSHIIIQGGARCSEKMFYDMTTRVVRAPMSYFETTPMGRILNRLTYDVEILDITLSQSMTMLIIATGWFVTGIVLQITILPWNVFVLVPILAIYWLLLLFYRKSATDLQRLDAVSRSPVQAILSEGKNHYKCIKFQLFIFTCINVAKISFFFSGMDGSSTIKAFGRIKFFEDQFKNTLDGNTSAMMNFLAAQRWLGVRFQIIGSFVVLFAGIFVVAYNGVLMIDTGLIAMLIIWSASFPLLLNFFSIGMAETEACMTSVERVKEMAELPQESEFETELEFQPESEWPSDGNLIFDDVCLRYRPGLPLALKGLSFTAKPGQRVGICGRTGAGKSSISVALFRLAELDSGKIILDGHDISKLELADVRGRKNGMCIIPQDPVLFSGSLRECLDPWGQSSDDEILEALTMVKVVDAVERGLQALEDYVDEGGRNFSVGERQLLCLARTMLQKPTVLVLDEATASVDGETDAFIQRLIRSRFRGTTLLTIAHRLNTIMDYDVVLVMDNGKVAEFGSPKELLSDEDGLFSGLIDSTGKESSIALRKMAI